MPVMSTSSLSPWARTAQLSVGLFLLMAAIAKAWAFLPFAATIRYALSFLPAGKNWSPFLAGAVILWEGLLGWLLIMNVATRSVVLAAIATLVVLSAFLLRILSDPAAPSCHCAGILFFSLPNSLSLGLIRNAVLVAALAWVWHNVATLQRNERTAGR